jgi:hypothetical protein
VEEENEPGIEMFGPARGMFGSHGELRHGCRVVVSWTGASRVWPYRSRASFSNSVNAGLSTDVLESSEEKGPTPEFCQ